MREDPECCPECGAYCIRDELDFRGAWICPECGWNDEFALNHIQEDPEEAEDE